MNKIPLKFQPWIDARRRFKLSHAHIQMARELGMNPKKMGSIANQKQEQWKVPLQEFIAGCYFKRFNRSEPAEVRSLEQLIEAEAMRRKTKLAQKAKDTLVSAKDSDIAKPDSNASAV
ncbi:hypothetical protein [Propionivibrio sp.]|uniref:hypothetical protein n=1 Tax=Propionivibrio sp. TaxID=2212460 RepID=UPI003BF15814